MGLAQGSLPGVESMFNKLILVPWIPTLQGPDSGCPLASPPLEIHCWFGGALNSGSQFHGQSLSVSESPCWRAGVSESLPGKSEVRGQRTSPMPLPTLCGSETGENLETLVLPQ